MPESDDRPNAQVIPVAEFEGEYVRAFEAKLPQLTLDMAEGYLRGTHLLMQVEVRVRNVHYDEVRSDSKARGVRRGDLIRQHLLALEEIRLVDAFDPASRPSNVGGNAAGKESWVEELLAFLDGDVDELNFDGREIPDRLRDMLKAYFDSPPVQTAVGTAAPVASDPGEVGF